VRRFYLSSSQDKNATCQAAFQQNFKNQVNMIEHCGGLIGEDTGLVNKTALTGNTSSLKTNTASTYIRWGPGSTEVAKQQYFLAYAFVLAPDHSRHGPKNDYTQKVDKHPKNLNNNTCTLVLI
jgi:hypothetical protein